MPINGAMAPKSPGNTRRRTDLIALVALAIGGLALLGAISHPYWSRIALGYTDFMSFYAGGRLAFTPGLYDPPLAMAEQARAVHATGEGTYFIRMPWFAAAMWPLARLSYVPAQLIWQALLFAGLAAFIVLWPRPPVAIRAVILCFSLPAMISILMGQDVPLLLACMAASLALFQRGKPLAAGLVLSLTLAKFHLFLPLFPAVLFARRWSFSTGLFGGSAILTAASFLVSGPDWPRRFIQALRDPAITPTISKTPSFYYLIHGTPAARNLAIAAIGITLMVLYLRIARRDVEFLIAAAPAVILPLLPHAGAYDCLLLTPLAMLALDAGSREAKIAAALLLFPVTYFLAWSFPSCSMLIPILDVTLLGLSAMPRLAVPRDTISSNLSTLQSSASPAAPARMD
jgi:hypothetical protein